MAELEKKIKELKEEMATGTPAGSVPDLSKTSDMLEQMKKMPGLDSKLLNQIDSLKKTMQDLPDMDALKGMKGFDPSRIAELMGGGLAAKSA